MPANIVLARVGVRGSIETWDHQGALAEDVTVDGTVQSTTATAQGGEYARIATDTALKMLIATSAPTLGDLQSTGWRVGVGYDFAAGPLNGGEKVWVTQA